MVHMQTPSERIREAVRTALHDAGMGARRFESTRGLRKWALRGLLDPEREQVPSVDRAAEICAALGLELTVGPPRDTGVSPPDTHVTGRQAPLENDAGASEAATLRAVVGDAVKTQIETLRAEVVARLPTPVPTRQIEVMEIAAAAGGGAEAEVERTVGALAFRRDWLDDHGLDPTQCVVIGVRGASMEPTLPDGSRILVNRARRRRRAGRLYVLRTDDGLVVKRAGKDTAGRWLLNSDNPSPDYPQLPWPDDAEIVGEVWWMARTFE